MHKRDLGAVLKRAALLAAMTWVCCSASASDWMHFAVSESGADVYIDRMSLEVTKQPPRMARIWTRAIGAQGRQTTLYEYDCDKRLMRILQWSVLTADGRSHTVTKPSDTIHVTPDSLGEALQVYACTRDNR